MKRFTLGLVAASLLVTTGVAHAQSYAIPKSQQSQMTRLAPKGPTWPADKNGNPIPNAQNQCPPGYRYVNIALPNPFPGGGVFGARACIRN